MPTIESTLQPAASDVVIPPSIELKLRSRVIAFYLPQFHPVPENDMWWGPGFTEWTNVARARPLFRGHQQPHIPGDLGFYDLRCNETRDAQARLAKCYGVEAFCYWHYWFGGRRILHRPFDEVLASGEPRHSFCLGWANHTWSGIWDGAPNRTLIEQVYPGPEDDQRHFDHLLTAFRDERYFRVDGKPLFYIFRPNGLPEPKAFCERWQTMARKAGLEGLYLVAEMSDLSGRGATLENPAEVGFDAGVYIRLPFKRTPWSERTMLFRRRYLRWPEVWTYAGEPIPMPAKFNRETVHPCVYPNWDNSPRSGRRGLVLRGANPELFRIHVKAALEQISDRAPQKRLLFIKSWNEWAEGNYLEPDREDGHGYLEALYQELTATSVEENGRSTSSRR